MGRCPVITERALTLPLQLDAFGRFASSSDQSKIWADRVRMVVGTNLRERLMRSEFGSLVPSAFMETQEMASVTITSEVEQAFSNQLQTLKLQSVDVSFDDYSGSTNVEITYDLPNGEQVSTVVAFIYLSGTQPFYEENL